MEPTQPNLNQPEPQKNIFNKMLKITLILLIIILIGLGGFLFLQLNKKTQSPNTSIPASTASPTTEIKKDQTIVSPTVQSEDPSNIDIGSIETDLKDIETDIKGLQ